MKSKLAIFLILIGFLTLAGQIVHRSKRDSAFYSQQLQAQKLSIEEGLKSRWSDYLLQAAQSDKLKAEYSLRVSRDGQTLRQPFFPSGKSEANWDSYREFRLKKDQKSLENFLREILKGPANWDRALAVEEWKKAFKAQPPAKLSPYESTLVSSEAKAAFTTIFSQLAAKPDFSTTTSKIEFERAFFRATGDGDIEIFVPSIKETKTLVEEFVAEAAIEGVVIASGPWDIRFLRAKNQLGQSRWYDAAFLMGSAGFFVAGILLFLFGLRDQRRTLSNQVSFLNQVVHELKTPLTGLKLHTQLMRNYGPSPDSLEGLETSVNRMNQLFDDIVTINRPNATVEKVAVSKSQLNEMVANLRREANGKALVRGEFQDGIVTDPARLNLILRNLIRNAIKYGEFAEVTIEHVGSRFRIEVKDRGNGVAKADAEKIFQEFFRADEGRRKTADGLGLGLSLAKRLATELGMELRLLNPGERGARFELKFAEKLK